MSIVYTDKRQRFLGLYDFWNVAHSGTGYLPGTTNFNADNLSQYLPNNIILAATGSNVLEFNLDGTNTAGNFVSTLNTPSFNFFTPFI